MAASTRDRIVEATARLLQQRGYAGSGLKQIAADSDAPFGSVYHHFPGGKEELAAESLRWSGQAYQRLVEAVLDAEVGIVDGLRSMYVSAAAVLEETDYADACPIATVALEVASTNEPLRRITAEIFEGWIDTLARRFVAEGVDAACARELSILAIGSLESGFLLCRAAKDTEAMHVLGRFVVDAVAAATLRAATSAAAG